MGFVMEPLYYAVSAILLGWHWLFDALGLSQRGWIWVLAIAGLTVTIRALLIPLFVKQIKSSRNMQLLQPQIKELQKKYGHDRQKLAEEQMKLWKETGTNPFASCLPLLLQMPIFFALFNVINNAAKGKALRPAGSPRRRRISEGCVVPGRSDRRHVHEQRRTWRRSSSRWSWSSRCARLSSSRSVS